MSDRVFGQKVGNVLTMCTCFSEMKKRAEQLSTLRQNSLGGIRIRSLYSPSMASGRRPKTRSLCSLTGFHTHLTFSLTKSDRRIGSTQLAISQLMSVIVCSSEFTK